MVKKGRHLQVLTAEQTEPSIAPASPLEILSLSELNDAQRKRVEFVVRELCPEAALLGVAVSARPWDLRPFVANANEEAPSMIRFLGPEVSLRASLFNRMQDQLKRLSEKRDLFHGLKAHGVLEEQLWYRRSLVDHTLGDVLAEVRSIGEARVLALFERLIDAVLKFHQQGFVHGHITIDNIVLASGGRIGLVDVGYAASLVQSSSSFGYTDFPAGYKQQSFAPEVIGSEALIAPSDVYGLGNVLGAVISKCSHWKDENTKQALRNLQGRMTSTNLTERPHLENLQELVNDLARGDSTKPHKTMVQKLKGDSVQFSRPQMTSSEPALVETSPTEAPKAVVSKSKPDKQGQSWLPFFVFAFFVTLALALTLDFSSLSPRFGFSEVIEEELVISEMEALGAWQSGQGALMAVVARETLRDNEQGERLRQLLLDISLPSGQNIPSLNQPLLRIAFNSLWDEELSNLDRRFAIAMALIELVPAKDIPELNGTMQLHPGVLLALAATVDEAASGFLSKLSAERLELLPPPFGPAFKLLTASNSELSLASEEIRLLSKIGTNGGKPSIALAVNQFLSDDTALRLRSLALLFAKDSSQARQVSDIALNHPNLRVSHPQLDWGRRWRLLSWGEISGSDQLLVLAGLEPVAELEPENVAKLFAHPAPSLRAFAYRQALDKIPFKHPGAIKILTLLSESPEVLDPNSSLQLAKIIENPSNVSREEIRRWMDSGPPIALVKELILSTAGAAGQAGLEAIDFEVMRFLRRANWRPEPEEISILSQHPDDLTRVFSYVEAAKLADTKQALKILQAALKKENNPRFKKQIKLNIDTLTR